MWAFSRNQRVQAGDSFRQELDEKRCSDSLPLRDRRQGPHRVAGEQGRRDCLSGPSSQPLLLFSFPAPPTGEQTASGCRERGSGGENGGGHALLAQQGSWPGLPRLTHFPGC